MSHSLTKPDSLTTGATPVGSTVAAPGTAPPVLEVDRLVIQTSGQRRRGTAPLTIVDQVGFTLARGEVLGLIGESGAGKSTIGLATLGYTRRGLAITGGRILFDGRDVRSMTLAERRALRGAKVAYIAQSAAASFNPAKTLLEQVTEVPIRHGLMAPEQARAEAIGLFRELDLPKPETIGDRYPHQVSGGQLQRAMAAMAMAARPALVVFDEPTTALDVTTQVEVLAAFARLVRDHGTAALYITHDLAVVAQMADRILVLRHGREVEIGATSQILHQPRQEYTRRLVAERTGGTLRAGHGLEPAAVKDAPPLLSIRQVVASYGALRAVDRVSLDVERGDTFAVVGESGSGKSTLARVITGLMHRAEGDILLDGQSLPPRIAQRRRALLRRIQIIFQMPDQALNPRQRVCDIIARPMQLYFNLPAAEIRRRVAQLMAEMELPEGLLLRRSSDLSGGQKQRVSIARALAAEPDLVICDEVTSALDQLVAEEILKLLKRLQDQRGLAYLFITHDLGTVRRIANKVAVMQHGRVVTQGPIDQVFSPPFDPYTELLLSSVPELRTDWLDGVLARRRAAAA